jgi:hypothetical protein
LPEDVGIGQLPAQNIANMAEGGIVAFGDGGEIPRYQDKGLVQVPRAIGNPMGDNFTGFQGSDSDLTFMERLGLFNPANRRALEAAEKRIAEQKRTNALIAELPTGTASSKSPSNADIESMIGIGAPSKTDAGSKGASDIGGGSAATKRQPQPGLESVDAFANQLTGVDKFLPPKEKAKDREAFLAEREGINKPFYEKASKLIEDEKNRLKGDKEQSFYMSLIEGGLAAAGGSSQYGLQNLAQGFSKGTASFGEALKDLRKAAKENSKMELEMERAKAADKRGDMDAYQKHEDSIRESNAKIDQLKTSGIFGLMGDKMRADATVKAAGIAASAPGAQERLFMALGGGDINKGLERFQAAQADKTGATYAKLYSDYAANADKAGAEKMSPVEFAQNIQLFMGSLQGGGFQQAPGQGTVRKLPGT